MTATRPPPVISLRTGGAERRRRTRHVDNNLGLNLNSKFDPNVDPLWTPISIAEFNFRGLAFDAEELHKRAMRQIARLGVAFSA